MSVQWDYHTWQVEHGETKASTRRDRVYGWLVHRANGEWDGWNEILAHIGNEGWEIFSVVGTEGFSSTGSSGTRGFRIFAKKPK